MYENKYLNFNKIPSINLTKWQRKWKCKNTEELCKVNSKLKLGQTQLNLHIMLTTQYAKVTL